ncbi:hypothetical protein LXL04_033557 [Taraxacum kok-saghyz]
MASSNSPSSSHEPTDPLAAQPPTSTAASRRVPLPCWSHDETVALIDAYRGKWYSLQRGNLRAPHWQEVADGVAAQCPLSNPPKTSIQCRHKMEKLRKRYRAEIQRIGNTPRGHRYPSSWVHFKQMDAMELGISSSDPSADPTNYEDDDEVDGGDEDNEEELFLYPKGIKQAIALPPNRRYQGSSGNAVAAGNGNRNGNGVRIKFPNTAAVPPPPPYKPNTSYDDYLPPMNPHYRSGKRSRDGFMKDAFGSGKSRTHHGGGGGMKRRNEIEKNDSTLVDGNGMVTAIQKLGDAFLKIERMKMEMARELESMRMKMEMKRTEMILESHQRLVESNKRKQASPLSSSLAHSSSDSSSIAHCSSDALGFLLQRRRRPHLQPTTSVCSGEPLQQHIPMDVNDISHLIQNEDFHTICQMAFVSNTITNDDQR